MKDDGIMKKSGQLKIGAVLSYINLVIGNLIALFYTPFMLNCLGQAEYGTYSVVNSIVSYLTIFDLGFSNVIVRYGAQYKAEKNEKKEQELYGGFIVVYVLIGVAVLLIGIFMSQHLGLFRGKFQEEQLHTAEVLMIMAVINIAVSFPMGVFRAVLTVNEEFFFLRILDFARTIISPCCIVVLLLMGYKAIALMAVTVALNLIVMIFHMIFCFCTLNLKLRLVWFTKNFFLELFNYSLLVAIGMIIDKIYWSTDQIILAAVHGPESTAIYSIGVTFPSYFIAFSLAVSNVLLPRVTMIATANKDEKDRDKELSDMFLMVGRIQFWILALILTGFALWGKQFIVTLWVGSGYEEAYYIALIIMIPSIISLTQNTGISILQAKKKLKFRTYSYLVIALINIAISIPMAYRWGGIGSALGTTFGTVVGPIVCMNIYYWKKVGIDIPAYWKNIVRMSCSLILPVLCGIYIRSVIEVTSYIDLLISAGIYTLLYSACAYFMGMNSYEKGQIKVICKKIIKRR